MEVQRSNFPEIMKDNDQIYISHVCGIIESIDELCSLQIRRTPYHYQFRIAPSLPKYINLLIHEITKLNNMYGIRLNFGKSIKTSSVITFNVELGE